jgi:hypothetical protein
MNRLSKFFQPFLECIGGVFFELARLFAHRKMEQQELELQREHRQQIAQREAIYNARLNELRNSKDAHIKTLSTLLQESNIERKRLQDRVLQKAGSLPIFEEREGQRADPQQTQARDRVVRVADRTKTAIESQREAIKKDVDEYLQEVNAAGQAG